MDPNLMKKLSELSDEDYYEKILGTPIKHVKYEGKIPKCTDEKTYRAWIEAARAAPPPPKFKFCYDCTPEYKEQMMAEGRCENPKVKFVVDRDGFICGEL